MISRIAKTLKAADVPGSTLSRTDHHGTEFIPASPMPRKFFLLAIILGLGLILPGYEVVNYLGEQTYERLNPVRLESLEVTPATVDLGIIGLGEIREAVVSLKNVSDRPIVFLPPEADCGCILTRLDPMVLKSGKTAVLRNKVRAPGVPEAFRRSVYVKAAGNDTIVWKMNFTGRSYAEVWAEPPLLDVEVDPGQDVQLTLKVHHEGESIIEPRISSDKFLQVQPLELVGDSHMSNYEIHIGHIGRAATGTSKIDFIDQTSNTPVLTVPLHWRQRLALKCVPNHLAITAGDFTNGRFQRRFFVFSRSPKALEDLNVESLAAWVQITDKQRRDNHMQLVAEFNPALMPANIAGPIIKVRSVGESETAHINASGKRGL